MSTLTEHLRQTLHRSLEASDDPNKALRSARPILTQIKQTGPAASVLAAAQLVRRVIHAHAQARDGNDPRPVSEHDWDFFLGLEATLTDLPSLSEIGTLFYFGDCSYEETARVLDVSRMTVYRAIRWIMAQRPGSDGDTAAEVMVPIPGGGGPSLRCLAARPLPDRRSDPGR